MKRFYYLAALVAATLGSAGIVYAAHPYVKCGPANAQFSYTVPNWTKGQKWCDDDNFFIGRVKPKRRFRNSATQVREDLSILNDKNLVFWVPSGPSGINAIPIGQYDGDVFSMWQYVTHYGNWSAEFMRCPGNFTDVAHKNGVGVSTIVATPYGELGEEWARSLQQLTDVGPEKISEYMNYYGIDGIGYNSEFNYPRPMYDGVSKELVYNLAALNAGVMKRAIAEAPTYCNIWYDGTCDAGYIAFDQGLDAHNKNTFGDAENAASSLFFNYNWNSTKLVRNSIARCEAMGRNPLDIYCGFNMQGREPSPYRPCWTMLKNYRLSIGLWGQHGENMFFETRNERGFTPEKKQETYLLRGEKFFTGGTRNPINVPPVTDDWGISASNDNFFGMSSFMTARSPLCWSLNDEPFITSFNIGNGKFFNWDGQRTDHGEWTNIGVQDYLPTWRWWWSKNFLGKDPNSVPANGLDASIRWDDAYMGGSCINITGSISHEYLHLFKTNFALEADDEISLTYRLRGGDVWLRLALSAETAESTLISSPHVVTNEAMDGDWHTTTFVVGRDLPALTGKKLAMIALFFENASNLDLNLGRLEIRRPSKATPRPVKPEIEKAEALAFSKDGIDAKIIYNMPNNITDRVCYNEDVNTSLFKIYYQQEGAEPRLKGITTSWAALLYNSAIDLKGSNNVRFGVAALSTDYRSESEIAWSEWIDCSDLYTPTPGIAISDIDTYVGEPFTIGCIDPRQTETFTWILTDADNRVVARTDDSTFLYLIRGLDVPGFYTLTLIGKDGVENVYTNYVHVLADNIARAPKIESFDFTCDELDNDEDKKLIGSADLVDGQKFTLSYTGRKADGVRSRGLHLTGPGFGFRADNANIDNSHPFSFTFWLCPENLTSTAQILCLRDKTLTWPKNEWGLIYQTYNPEQKRMELYIRFKNILEGTYNIVYDNVELRNGEWAHLGYAFDFRDDLRLNFRTTINGQPIIPTNWTLLTESGEGDPGLMGPTMDWSDNYYLAIGGNLHKSAGIEGYIDNVQLYNKALSYEELEAVYKDKEAYNPDNSLIALFDFEADPDDTYSILPSAGSNKNILSGLITYDSTALEGQGRPVFYEPTFGAGASHVKSDREVKTTAEWILPRAVFESSECSDTKGHTVGSFTRDGTFQACLRLSNSCGSDEQFFRFFKVAQGVHVGSVISEQRSALDSFAFEGDDLMLWISGNDTFTANVHAIDGKFISTTSGIHAAASPCTVKCPGPAGVYVLTLSAPDRKPITVKLHKK